MNPANPIAAAITLALTLLLVTIATIRQVEPEANRCTRTPCAAQARTDTDASNTRFEISLHRAFDRAERGLLKMAGMAPAR